MKNLLLRSVRHALLQPLLTLVFLGGCGLFPGSNTGKPVNAWVAGEMTNLSDRTTKFDDQTLLNDQRQVSLFSAANETVAFQVVVDAGSDGLSDVRLAGSALKGPGGKNLPVECIRIFRMLPVRVTEFPAWYLRLSEKSFDKAQAINFYDALTPINSPKAGQPFAAPASSRMAFWVDIVVPRTAVAGNYSGTLTINAASHGPWTIALNLQVYGFVLPDTRPVAAVGGFDHRTLFRTFIRQNGKPYDPSRLDRTNPLIRQGLGIMRQMMVLSHEHRLDLFETSLHPDIRLDAQGQTHVNWDDYDNIVTPYLTGSAFDDRVGCPAWPTPFCDSWPETIDAGQMENEDYLTTVRQLLEQSAEHFRELNVADQIFAWPYRGPVDAGAFARQFALAKLMRSVDVQTPILSQLPPAPPPLTLWATPADFAASMDIVAPPAQWLDTAWPAKYSRPGSPLRGVWLSPGLPPYLPGLSIASTPADVRAIPWFAMKYDCTGLFLPEVLNWAGDVFASPVGTETRLFYPGSVAGIEGVLPSARLKRLRRGLQDLSYLWILRQRERPGIADMFVKSLVRYAGQNAVGDNYQDVRLGGWIKESDVWEKARRLMAEEVQAAVHPDEPTSAKLLALQLAWRDLDERTHSIRVEQVRSFVRPDGDKLLATVLLDLYNEFSRDVDVQVGIETLPDGWTPLKNNVQIARMPAASRKTVILTAQAPQAATGPTGKCELPIVITVDDHRRQDLKASVAYITAGRIPQPPKIDGVLSDWVLRPGNVAGQFKMLGQRGQIGTGMAGLQTSAFVLCDDQNLYVAFRCDDPGTQPLKARASNIIHYDQLMACNEDLVEIILDPGAAAKGPEDLYHIIVKPNGVLLTEKGVHTDPPLGKAEPWPVAALVEVRTADKTWVVEMSIPLSAFGPAGKAKFWGVNFTRFSTATSEASSWSGAPRYFYDPRNLGTMLMATD